MTHELDDNWKYIKERLEKRKISAIFYTSIEEEKTNNLQDVLTFMASDLTNQEEDKEENINDLIQVMKFDGKKNYKVKVKSSKKKTPKFMIIFDDMSGDLLNKDVAVLLKNLRHFGAKTIISSQYPNDLEKQAKMNIDFSG